MANPVVHFEIGCKDGAAGQKFYSELFDWKFEAYGEARMINTGSEQGIQGHINSLGHEPHNYCAVYVQVDDIDAYLAKAEELGGKKMVPKTEIPGMGWFAWLTDPEGNIVGLWTPAQQ
ncbi:MAG: VOC family protein [Candidatus Zixiibacteriota bacterium]